MGEYCESKNLIEATKIFQELMNEYMFHIKNMDEYGKQCFKYFYTIIKSDYQINDKVIKYIEAIGYENDLDISCDLDYSYTLASFNIKRLNNKVKKLKKEW